MDSVDDHTHLSLLNELNLDEEDTNLLNKLATRFTQESRYLLVQRGLSTAIKVVLKPARLFPFLVKLDLKDEIEAEYSGDQLVRLRTPPLSIPPFEAFEKSDTHAALMYRYITGGRVKDVVDRLDIHLGKVD